MPISRISGAIPLVPLYALMTRAQQLYYVLGRSECTGNTVVYKTVSLAVGAFTLQPRPGTLALGLQNSRQLESSLAQMWLFIVRCFVDTGGVEPRLLVQGCGCLIAKCDKCLILISMTFFRIFYTCSLIAVRYCNGTVSSRKKVLTFWAFSRARVYV